MTDSARPLNFIDHGKVIINDNRHFPHISEQQVVPLIVHEFSKVAAELPIVFVKNAETEQYQPVAIMGFQEGENLLYGDPEWRGNYVPAVIMHSPFALMPSKENPEDLQMIIIETDEVLNGTEGKALFTESGEETPYLTQRKEALGTYYENMHITKAFVSFLHEKSLLIEQQLTINLGEEKRQLSGLYLVDERKLNELSDEDFLTMKSRGYLAPIYAHMLSIHQMNNLARLKMNT